MLNRVYLQLLIQLFQILLLPERKHCCRCGWKQIGLHRLWSCSDWRCQSPEWSSHCSPICWMNPHTLTCFPAEPLHVLFWQKLLHDPAQLQNCFFLLGLVFWVALLPLHCYSISLFSSPWQPVHLLLYGLEHLSL